MFSVCVSVLGEGDEVIVPEPFYATYPGIFATAGATTVNVPLRPEREFQLDVADVEAALTRAHARDRPDDAEQPDRRVHAGRDARGARRDLPRAQPLADLRRGLRLAALRWPQARERARRGRRRGARRGHLEPLEVARDDRLAHRLGGRAGGAGRASCSCSTACCSARRRSSRTRRRPRCARRTPRRTRCAPPTRAAPPSWRARRPGGPALPHADGRDVHHARRPRLRPARHRVRRAAAREGGRLGAADRGLRPERAGHVRLALAADEERLAEGCRRIARFAASLRARAIAERYEGKRGPRSEPSSRRGRRSRRRRSRRSPPRCPTAAPYCSTTLFVRGSMRASRTVDPRAQAQPPPTVMSPPPP